MLRIRLIVVDRTRAPFLKEGESFYLGRLRKYVRVEWIEVKPARIKRNRPPEDVMDQEGEAIAQRLTQGDYLVALDPRGDQYDSEEMASWLNLLSSNTQGWVCFVIGGPLGLSRKILDRAHKTLSLSRLTLTHEMSRLFLLEQIYRSITIMKGQKYHK